MELITKTRLEHLSEADKARARAPRTPLQSFLGIAEQQQESCSATTTSVIFFSIIFNYRVILYARAHTRTHSRTRMRAHTHTHKYKQIYYSQIIYFRKNLIT